MPVAPWSGKVAHVTSATHPGASPRVGRTDWDLYSKQSIRAGVHGVLAHFGIDVSDRALTFQPVELPASTLIADLVFAGPDGLVIHIEIQRAPDASMGLRMVEYAIRIVRNWSGGPVTRMVQIVIQLSGVRMPTRFTLGGLVNDVMLLHVPTTDPEVFLATPALSPFALSGQNADLVAPVVERLATLDTDLQVPLTTLAVYLAPELGATLLQQLRRANMIHTIDEVTAGLRDTEIGRHFLDEGRQEGRQEGWVSGARDTLVALLGARFPHAPAAQIERTVDRLLAEHGHHVARAAITLGTLDS